MLTDWFLPIPLFRCQTSFCGHGHALLQESYGFALITPNRVRFKLSGCGGGHENFTLEVPKKDLRYRRLLSPTLGVEDGGAGDHGADDLEIFDLRLIHGERIVGQHNEVGKLPGCDGPFNAFLV